LVDWTVGCSTGALLGLALAKGNTLGECFFLYWEMKNEIFLDKSTMKRLFGNVTDKQTIRVNNVLNRVFSEEDTFLSCKQRLTVPALDVSTTPGRLITFRNYATRKQHQPDDISFRDAARASSAAPTYFHPHIMGDKKFVDGSLVANCPLSILFAEYDKSLQGGDNVQLGLVISVGTGEPAETKRRYQSGSSLGRRSRHIRDMAVLLMEQVGFNLRF
jgi:patatin-like phospholipase/acyl hydrolase